MEEGRPSRTAQMAALLRAAHLLVDGEPKILVDELAGKFLGIDTEEALRHSLQTMEAAAARSSRGRAPNLVRYTRATAVLRSRYVEDELSKALKRGMDQFVILGAGLDSFAYRRPDLADVVQVFEVDHPTRPNRHVGATEVRCVKKMYYDARPILVPDRESYHETTLVFA